MIYDLTPRNDKWTILFERNMLFVHVHITLEVIGNDATFSFVLHVGKMNRKAPLTRVMKIDA